jgi:hypothetical protein
VTGTTSLGPWVNRRKLFARQFQEDVFKRENIPSTAKWEFTPEGQHIELGIAEMNLFLLLGAAGLSHSLFGKRLIPIGTVYDPFVARGLDALNYACYQDARFMIVGTPSGVTLAPEGGAHQSIGSPLIGMSAGRAGSVRAGLCRRAGRDHGMGLRLHAADGEGDPDERTWLRDETGGSVYLRLTTNPIEQPGKRADDGFPARRHRRRLLAAKARAQLRGGDRLPGGGGARGHRAAGIALARPARRRRSGRHLGRPAQRRLDRGTARAGPGQPSAQKPYRDADWPPCPALPDCHRHRRPPGHAGWLGSVAGHQTIPLGVEHFGQTGTIGDLYHHFGIDVEDAGHRKPLLDHFLGILGATVQPGSEFLHRGRQDEDRDHISAHLILQLLRTLPVDVEQHVAAFAHRHLGSLARRAVEIAMHLGPLQQRLGIAHALEFAMRLELVVDAIDLAAATRPRGHADREAQAGVMFEKIAGNCGFSGARRRGNHQHEAAPLDAGRGKMGGRLAHRYSRF